MASGLAAYVSRDGYPPNRARLASRCWSGSPGRAWYPQGSYERFSTHIMFVVLLSQPSRHDPRKRSDCSVYAAIADIPA